MIRTVVLSTIALAAAGCHVGGHAEQRDAGPETSRSYQAAGFDRIEVAGPYDVAVTTGGNAQVTATGGANLLDETEVVVKDGALVIRPKKHKGIRFHWTNGKAKFLVNAEAIRAATIAGSGGISIDKSEGDFEAEIAGSGSIGIAAMNGGATSIEIAGSGDFTGTGTVDSVDVEIAGSGDVHGAGLKAKTADVSIAGSGNVQANASDTAEIKIMGSGNVDITGGAKCNIKKHGSGNVRCS